MKLLIICFVFFIGLPPVKSQELKHLIEKFDSLNLLGDDSAAFAEIREAKSLLDYKFYQTFARIVNKADSSYKIIGLIALRKIPWQTFPDPEKTLEGYRIYLRSTMELIKYSKNRLEILQNIEVDVAFRQQVYPYLRRAIEEAGGIWKHEDSKE